MPLPPSAPTVSTGLLRNASAYRSAGRGRESHLGVGFITKPRSILDFVGQPQLYSAVWCLRGSGSYQDHAGASWPLRAGSLFHRFTDRPHRTTFDPGCNWAECFISLSAELANGLAVDGILDLERPVQHPGIDLGLVTELSELVGTVTSATQRELPLLTVRLVGILASLCSRDRGTDEDDPHRDLIEHACRRLTDDPRLDLARLARESGLSYERFRKLFRERVGISPGEYRIRRRIDRARTLLQTPDRAVKAVAEELGYPNPYAFSAQFKIVVGESPETYRQRH